MKNSVKTESGDEVCIWINGKDRDRRAQSRPERDRRWPPAMTSTLTANIVGIANQLA